MKNFISIILFVIIYSTVIAGELKVGSKKASPEGTPAAQKNAPTSEKEEGVKTLTYKKVGDVDLEMKIYEKADHAFNFSPTGSKATHQDMDDFFVSLGYLKTKDLPTEKN